MHRGYKADDDLMKTPGTGPFEVTNYSVGNRVALQRRKDFPWFGGPVYLDGIEFIDYGADANAMVAAFESGEIDANYQTTGDTILLLDQDGFPKTEVVTAATIVLRTNVTKKPYDNQDVRKALQYAVSNDTVLKIGYNGLGTTGRRFPRLPDPSRIRQASAARARPGEGQEA